MKQAVVLMNMGGPANLEEVELFLKNMFADPNILTIKNSFLRKIVGSLIVKRRKEQSKRNYEMIGGKSPLLAHTEKLVEKLKSLDSTRDYHYVMRYTPPFASEIVDRLVEEEIEEIVLFSLYPQYSTATTKSSIEDFLDAIKQKEWKVDVKIVDRYFDHIGYNLAIVDRIKEALKGEESSDFDLIFSAHGLPQKLVDQGDPYQKEIEENVVILKKMLEGELLHFKGIHLSYQSKVGPMRWLEPSTLSKIEELQDSKIVVYPLAFTLDNSETDFELSIEYKEEAEKLGVKEYRVAKCLNDSALFANAIIDMVKSSQGASIGSSLT